MHSVFPLLDLALTDSESKASRPSRTPAVWPSEASAERVDQAGPAPTIGKCHRASFFRMTGQPVTNPASPQMAWRWVTGRMIEEHTTELFKMANLFAAAGVKVMVPDIYLPYEMDIISIDPTQDNQAIINECKTFYGYYATKEIKDAHKPKLENLMQVCLYLNEVQTGARLKELIRQGLADKELKPHVRNRIEADLAKVETINDGPIGAKLLYISRDECDRIEFDIGIMTDFDGARYPTVNGHPWKVFTIDSIYDRYRLLQSYWFAARHEAYQRLANKGILKPETLTLVLRPGDQSDDSQDLDQETRDRHNQYLETLAEEVRRLPQSFWPPAEYEWSYSSMKVEELFKKGEVTKTSYTKWKAGKDPKYKRIGDFQCSYCNYRTSCVPTQNQSFAYQLYNISEMMPLEDEAA